MALEEDQLLVDHIPLLQVICTVMSSLLSNLCPVASKLGICNPFKVSLAAPYIIYRIPDRSLFNGPKGASIRVMQVLFMLLDKPNTQERQV